MMMRCMLDGHGSIPDRGKRFSLHHDVQIDSGANPASHPLCTGVLPMEVKHVGHEADC
jgi:hypothetical protein